MELEFLDSTIEGLFNSTIVYAKLEGYEFEIEPPSWSLNICFAYYRTKRENSYGMIMDSGYYLRFNIFRKKVLSIQIGVIGAVVQPQEYETIEDQKFVLEKLFNLL